MTSATAHSLLRNARYANWLISDTAKGLASSLAAFAIPLIALIATDDPAQAGIIGAVGVGIRTATMMFGGVLADRHNRITMMILGSVVGVLLSGAFTALALTDALTFTALLVLNAALAARAGLFDVAGEAALKQIVPAAAMGRAQAANQGRDAVLQLVGGPLGGVLLAAGAWLIGAAMALCHLVAMATGWMLRRALHRDAAAPQVEEADAAASATPVVKPNALREIGEGFRWLFTRPDLRGVIFVATIINLGFSTALTTVIYALQQSGHSPVTIGLLSTASGLAMLAGAFVAPLLVSRVPASIVIIGGLAVATIGIIGMIPANEPVPLMITLGVTVFFVPAVNAALMGYFMVAIPTEMLGRANSASNTLGMGATPLAPLIAGFGLAIIGRENTLIVASALCAISVLLAVATRGLRALPAEAGWAAHARQFERAA